MQEGKALYEEQQEFYCAWTGSGERPWEALPSQEKQRWEELAFELELKNRKEAV